MTEPASEDEWEPAEMRAAEEEAAGQLAAQALQLRAEAEAAKEEAEAAKAQAVGAAVAEAEQAAKAKVAEVASEAEVDALVARYDSTGARGILVSDFCKRLLAPDFPTAAEKEKRRADGVVSAFRRAFKDEVSRHRGDGIGEDDDAATVSTRDALSAAARAAKAAKRISKGDASFEAVDRRVIYPTKAVDSRK